jgi:aspartyl protease family protein
VVYTGHAWVEIRIANMEKTRSRRVNALVDTGASLTVLPKQLADDLGIAVIAEERVTTGAGEVKIKRGRAWLSVKGKEDAFPVWISGVIDKVLLGVVVLESFGFEVDPAIGLLKERPLLLYPVAPYR